MNRQQALDILELTVEATPAQIEQRYEMLLRRYRLEKDEASQTALNLATQAYEALKAAARPIVTVSLRDQQKILGHTRADWANRWHYDKWLWLGILAVVGVVIYIIVTIVANKPADLKIVTIGRFVYKDDTIWQEQVTQAVQDNVIAALQPNHPEVDTIDYEAIPIDFNLDGSLAETDDPATQQNLLIKAVARIGADTLDVLILDQGAYAAYASQAQFADLSGLADRLQNTLSPDQFAQIEQLTLVPEGDPQTLSGLDITALDVVGDLGLKSESTIVVIGPRSRDQALAAEWLYAFISSSTN